MSLTTNNEWWSSYEMNDGVLKERIFVFLTAFFKCNLARLITMTSTKPHGFVTQRVKM
jgi:hypothetical protein